MAVSDAEFVNRMRRMIAFYKRWRFALIVLYLVLLGALVVLVIQAQEIVNNLGGIAPGAGMGFPIGVIIGFKVGILIVVIGHGLVNAIIGAGRCQHMVVKYYDACNNGETSSMQ